MFDTHLHTSPFSTDSSMTLSELRQRQMQDGMGLVLTEHIDFGYPEPEEFRFSPSEYFEKYLPFRNDRLLLGAEVGMQNCVLEQNKAFVRSAPFDMVIASIHMVDGYDIYYPDYFGNFPDKKAAYRHYLEVMLENLQSFHDFDTLGHIDYICRKAPYEDSNLYYQDFPELIDTILGLLIQENKALELNTRRLGDPDAVRALLPLYQRYQQLGGRYITIGSDAHAPSSVGAYFKEAGRLTAACRLTPVYFKERRRIL